MKEFMQGTRGEPMAIHMAATEKVAFQVKMQKPAPERHAGSLVAVGERRARMTKLCALARDRPLAS
jgi:hypothetical protein